MSGALRVERDGPVLVAALSRPEVRNALDLALTESLFSALETAENDPTIGALLLHGDGPGFCAGSDVKEMAQASMAGRLRIAERKAQLMRRIAHSGLPVVAAVHGFALGGGFMLAAGCDWVLSAAETRWRLPEVELGFFPPWGIDALARRVSVAAARSLLWGIEPIDGARAALLGLAEEAHPSQVLLARAREVAGRLAALPRDAARAVKPFMAEHGPSAALDALAREVYRKNCEAGGAAGTFARFTPQK
ncbi:MAG: enoyl-CoA hydratase/isomerase family protein [Proteobacteria bacterium]|nr:enoyl-CoA hydratase/isomerase family protein [Pseudomonadota bacterium]